MPTTPLTSNGPTREWQLAVAAGFVALTVFGAAVDSRSAIVDRSVTRSRPAAPAVAPPTERDLVREMLTHD